MSDRFLERANSEEQMTETTHESDQPISTRILSHPMWDWSTADGVQVVTPHRDRRARTQILELEDRRDHDYFLTTGTILKKWWPDSTRRCKKRLLFHEPGSCVVMSLSDVKDWSLDLDDLATVGVLLGLLRSVYLDEGIVLSSGEECDAKLWGLTLFSGGNTMDLGADWSGGLRPIGEAVALALLASWS